MADQPKTDQKQGVLPIDIPPPPSGAGAPGGDPMGGGTAGTGRAGTGMGASRGTGQTPRNRTNEGPGTTKTVGEDSGQG